MGAALSIRMKPLRQILMWSVFIPRSNTDGVEGRHLYVFAVFGYPLIKNMAIAGPFVTGRLRSLWGDFSSRVTVGACLCQAVTN